MPLKIKNKSFSFKVTDKFELLPKDLSFAFGCILPYFNYSPKSPVDFVKFEGDKDYWFLPRNRKYAVFNGFEFKPSKNVSKFSKSLAKFLCDSGYLSISKEEAYSFISKGISDVYKIKPLRYDVLLEVPNPDWFNEYKDSNHEEIYGDYNSCFVSGKKRSYAFYFIYSSDGYFVSIEAFDDTKEEDDSFVGGARFLLLQALDENKERMYLAINPYSKGIPFTPALWVKVLSGIFDIPVDEIGNYLVFPGRKDAYEGYELSELIWVNGIGFYGDTLSKPYNLVVLRKNPRSNDRVFLRLFKLACMGCGDATFAGDLKIYTNNKSSFIQAVVESGLEHLKEIKTYMYNSSVYKAVLCGECKDKVWGEALIDYDYDEI